MTSLLSRVRRRADDEPPPWAPPAAQTPSDRFSLRARLLAIMLALIVLALVVASIGSVTLLRNYLVDRLDSTLATASSSVGRQFSEFGPFGGPRRAVFVPPGYAVLQLDANGHVVAGLPDPTQPDYDGPRLTSAGGLAGAPVLTSEASHHPFTVDGAKGGSWRVILGPVPNGGAYAVAQPLRLVDEPIQRLLLVELVTALGVLVVFGILGTVAVRRAFRPLAQIEQTAAAIAAGDLSQRVPVRSSRTEVGRLSGALNGMLAQIETAFRAREASEQRMRRFVADASHELRTPLAAVRGFAELYRQGAVHEPEDVARTMRRIEDESTRMGGLVQDLLTLARLDEQPDQHRSPVDLAVLAGDAVHDAHALAPERRVTLAGLNGAGPASAPALGDDARLRQVLANLVANALHHTATDVQVAVGTDGPLSVVEVRDHGPGLDPDQARRVFERFYRVDSSRTRGQGGGAGLGLAIVASIVASHDGQVRVLRTPGGGATFRVELPAAASAESSDPPD